MNIILKKNRASAVKAKTAAKKVSLDTVVSLLDKTLRTSEVKDRSVNGLQVEGAPQIYRVGLAVDACLEAYKLALEKNCQLVITHHGIIWDGLKSVSGPVYKHIEFLVKNDIGLYASHLPLDMHPTLGNNAFFAKALGLKNLRPFGVYHGSHISFEGDLTRTMSIKQVSEIVKKKFGGPVSMLPFGPAKIKRVAVLSGGGSAALAEAIEKKVDLFVTGEGKHEDYHAALEGKINVIYGGHYHTEKAGVIAVGEFLKKRFGIETVFLDVPTLL